MTAAVVVPAVLGGLAVAAALGPSGVARLGHEVRPRRGPSSSGPGIVPGSGFAPRLGGADPTQDDSGTPERPGTLVTGAAALGIGVGVALLVGSGTGIALGVAAVPVAWRWISRLEPAAVRRRHEQIAADLPLLVDLLAACLRAGQAPGSALAAVTASLEPGPLRTETARVVARLRLGGDPLTTWRAVGRHPQLGPVGRTVARALDGGASVADAMGDLAEELRRTRRADVQARARSVGAKAAAPLGLCLLPAFVLVGIVPVVAGSLGALLQR